MDSIVNDLKKVIHESIVVTSASGREFSPAKLLPVVDDRKIEPIAINTIDGLVDYICKGPDVLPETNVIVIVESHKRVVYTSRIFSDICGRHEYVETNCEDGNSFRFGQFMEAEEFIISLRSKFLDTDDLSYLLGFVSRLTAGNTVELADDGVTQEAVVKRGVSGALKTTEKARSILSLCPWRTFREVKQPNSDYLFRIRQNAQGVPTCALFEADGSFWKLEAMGNIKEYIIGRLRDFGQGKQEIAVIA